MNLTDAPLVDTAEARWRASLALEFSRVDARTVLSRRRHQGPLVVQKPLYPEGDQVCHAIVVHPPGGIAQGDHVHLDVQVADGAQALLTTPGATKWYRSDAAVATQLVQLEVQAGGSCEWLPQESIFFDRCNAHNTLEVRLHGDALALWWEVMCLGRSAAGERFTAGEIRPRSSVWLDDRLQWTERGSLRGGDDLLASPIGLSGHSVVASLVIAGRGVNAALLAPLREVESAGPHAGITALPHVVIARCLGDSSQDAKRWLVALWQVARLQLFGRVAVAPRIWST